MDGDIIANVGVDKFARNEKWRVTISSDCSDLLQFLASIHFL